MALKVVNTESLDAVANAINAKSGTSGALQFPEGFVDAIGAIQAGGGEDLSTVLTEQEELVAELKSVISRKSSVGDEARIQYMEGTLNKVTPEVLSGLSTTRKNMFRKHEVTSVEVPSNIKVIGENCFYECSSIKELILHEGIEEIKNLAFYSCTGIPSVVIPNSVKKLGNQVFNACSNLTSVIIGTGITYIPTSFITNASKLKSIDIPYGITVINNSSLNHCGFESLIIPDSVTTIGTHAFSYDKQLQTIKLSNALKSIADYLFNDCETLQNITIPSTVTSIGSSAFQNCYKLEYIDLTAYGANGTFPTLTATDAFTKTGSKTTTGRFEIRVPVGRASELAAMTNWSTYADNIVEV